MATPAHGRRDATGGPNGPNGPNGSIGPNSSIGSTRPNGTNSPNGTNGPNGLDGSQGLGGGPSHGGQAGGGPAQHGAPAGEVPEAAIVVVSIDGLSSLKSGIGSVVHWFFEAIDEIVAATAELRHDRWSLHALSPRLDPASDDYSDEVVAEVAAACGRHRGDYRWFDVEDNSSLKNVWSLDKVERWRTMCRNAAAEIRRLAEGRRRVTVLAHGTMFATLRSHLTEWPTVQVIYMTHTLGRVFLDANSGNRTAYEDEGFAWMRTAPQDRIGYVGTYYREVLLTEYDRQESDLVPFQNAIHVRSRRFADLAVDATAPAGRADPGDLTDPGERVRSGELLDPGDPATTTDLGPVPTDRRLVFSWGRCVPQKGFDVVIPAFGDFLDGRQDAEDWHLVLLAPQEVAASEYVATLREQLRALPAGSYTLIEDFDPLLPFRILASRALEICVFASRFEAGPLTLIEALAFGHPDLSLVWHDIPPMRHLLRDQPRTFGFTPLRTRQMADALLRAADEGGGIAKGNVTDFATSMSVGVRAAVRWWDGIGLPQGVAGDARAPEVAGAVGVAGTSGAAGAVGAARAVGAVGAAETAETAETAEVVEART